MAWQSLSTRINSTVPQVLAGPILRKVTPLSVSVWFALKSSAVVKLKVTTTTGDVILTGLRATCALGDKLHIVVVTANTLAPGKTGLSPSLIYLYDVTFDFPDAVDTSLVSATRTAPLTYAPYQKPSFCLPPDNINLLRLIHGSCRKPAGDGPDALGLLDGLIAQKASVPIERPHQLVLTGDQIYADDVASSFLVMLTDAANVLMGWDEPLALPMQVPAFAMPPYSRRPLLEACGFTSVDLDGHLLSLGEYLCMYLFVWSEDLWPADADVPGAHDVLTLSGPWLPRRSDLRGMALQLIENDRARLINFRGALVNVRRALANIPTYMAFDDHEVTDDWNMTLRIAADLHDTPLGRRTVQNALVAYSLCQHWGNVPEQFESGPAGALLGLLQNPTPSSYLANSAQICSLLSVHTSAEIRAHHAMLHDPGSLTFNFTVEGPKHQVIVTDTRTHRSFPRGEKEAPDLLPPAQFAEQIVNVQPPLGNRVQIVVLSTNMPPTQSIRTATRQHVVANALKHYPDLYESWELPSIAFDRLAKAIAERVGFDPSRSSKAVLLSGDVHSAFATRLHYRAINRFEDVSPKRANLVIAQLIGSGFKKQDEDTIGLQREGYRYGPPIANRLIPAHRPEYYIGWNVQPNGQIRGRWAGRNLRLDAASTVQLMRPHPSPDLRPLLMFAVAPPPDFSYQLDYLTITGGDILPNPPVPLPPLPASGATQDERDESAHVILLATTNYRQYNRDDGVIRHIIGVNNISEMSFTFPAVGDNKVHHRLRFRSTNGLMLSVAYSVVLDAVDRDHPSDPHYLQVTP